MGPATLKMFKSPDEVRKVHSLKSWPPFFDAILRGEKKHELRRWDDRHFEVGDVLQLNEFDPSNQRYTDRYCLVRVSYVTSSEFPCALSEEALSSTHCILSIEPLPASDGRIVRWRPTTRS